MSCVDETAPLTGPEAQLGMRPTAHLAVLNRCTTDARSFQPRVVLLTTNSRYKGLLATLNGPPVVVIHAEAGAKRGIDTEIRIGGGSPSREP